MVRSSLVTDSLRGVHWTALGKVGRSAPSATPHIAMVMDKLLVRFFRDFLRWRAPRTPFPSFRLNFLLRAQANIGAFACGARARRSFCLICMYFWVSIRVRLFVFTRRSLATAHAVPRAHHRRERQAPVGRRSTGASMHANNVVGTCESLAMIFCCCRALCLCVRAVGRICTKPTRVVGSGRS